MRHSRFPSLAFVLCALANPPALAAQGDALQVFGGGGYGYDDNLLRVPQDEPAFDGRRADSWWTREAGLSYERTYGRQQVSMLAKLSSTRFDHFRQLDYTGKDVQAKWLWQIGNHLSGSAGTTYQQMLLPYTDVRSDERNLRRWRHHVVDAAWRFHPSWQLRAAAARDTYAYELASQRYNDRREETSELELAYLARTGSTLGLVGRRIRGQYTLPRPFAVADTANEFVQDEVKLRLLWRMTGTTNVDVLAGHVRRRQAEPGTQEASALAGRVSANWEPGGKLSANAAIWREFAPLEGAFASYTLNNGANLEAVWAATAKIDLRAATSYERRQAATGGGPGGEKPRDALRTASLRATLSPRAAVQLTAGVLHQARSASTLAAAGKVASNSATLSASLKF